MKTLFERAMEHGYRLYEHDGLFDVYDEETKMLWQNAPLEDVAEYLSNPFFDIVERAAWDGLDSENFNVFGVLNYYGESVILMQKKQARTGYTPFCVEFRGSGRYFHDFQSMAAYAINRFGGRPLSFKREQALADLYHAHLKQGTPINAETLKSAGVIE